MSALKHCLQCGHEGVPQRIMPGSIFMEIILWLMFLIPGLIYSAWRHIAVYDGCALCKSKGLIPISSPRAAQLRGPDAPSVNELIQQNSSGMPTAAVFAFVILGMLAAIWLMGAILRGTSTSESAASPTTITAPEKAPAKKPAKRVKRAVND